MDTSSAKSRPQRSVVVVGLSFLAIVAALATVSSLAMGSMQKRLDVFDTAEFPAFNHLLHNDRDLFIAQYALITGLTTDDPEVRTDSLVEYGQFVERTEERWGQYLQVAKNSEAEVVLQEEYAAARGAWLAANDTLADYIAAGRIATDPVVAEAVGASQELFRPMRSAGHKLEEDFYEARVEQGIAAHSFSPRIILGLLLVAGVGLGGAAWALAMRDSAEQNATLRERDRTDELTAELQEMALAVENAADSIAIFDASQVLRYKNAAFVEHLDAAGIDDAWKLTDVADDDESRRQMSEDLMAGKTWTGTRSLSMSDGSQADLEARVAPVVGEDGTNTGFVAILRDVSEQRALEEQLEFRAKRDGLTGIPNRAAMHALVEELVRSKRASDLLTAVFYIDVDHFKLVNDNLGHAAGDKLLCCVAERVASALREGDVLGRVGGDEFLALAYRVVSVDEAMAIADRIVSAVAQPLQLGDRNVDVSVSVGVALAEPDMSSHELLAAADAAVYETKRNGRNRATLYDSRLRQQAVQHQQIRSSLKRALLEGGELVPFFQPIVNLNEGRTIGFEALVRWRHPERGLLRAQAFIEVAEQEGLEVPLGWSVMADVARQIAAWSADPRVAVPVFASVNVSARQFRDPSFAANVRRCLETTGIRPSLLCIEMAEETLIADLSAAEATLGDLRNIGVRVAVDDLGVANSSLTYMRALPVDIIKIDRSFTQAINDGSATAAVVAALVRMSKALGHSVIAEGIESGEQMATMQALRCELGQGYLFSSPVTAEVATDLLTGDRMLDCQGVKA